MPFYYTRVVVSLNTHKVVSIQTRFAQGILSKKRGVGILKVPPIAKERRKQCRNQILA